MRLLIDTHVLLWWLADDPELADRHRALIGDADNEVFVSAMTVAEIAIKSSLGKLDAPPTLLDALETGGFETLPFTAAHAQALGELPWYHRDPFDRMLVVQARVEGLTLLTADARIRQYEVSVA